MSTHTSSCLQFPGNRSLKQDLQNRVRQRMCLSFETLYLISLASDLGKLFAPVRQVEEKLLIHWSLVARQIERITLRWENSNFPLNESHKPVSSKIFRGAISFHQNSQSYFINQNKNSEKFTLSFSNI